MHRLRIWLWSMYYLAKYRVMGGDRWLRYKMIHEALRDLRRQNRARRT